MNQLTSAVKHLPKRFLVAGAVMGAVVTGVITLSAHSKASWGPDRPTYTMEQPADHVTFNSITNNPDYGDERTFFDAKHAATAANENAVDQIKVADGEEVMLRIYVHNDAAANLNGANFDGAGVSKNTRAQVTLPTVSGTALRSFATVMSDNANNSADPNNTKARMVQDTADLYADAPFTVEYVPGSAMAVSNAVPNGYKVDDSIVTSANGAQIGYKGPDGVVPGCAQYTMFVTIKVKVKAVAQPPAAQPNFTLEKSVQKLTDGSTWAKEVTSKPGDTVNFRVKVSNTGNNDMTGMVLADSLPAHLAYVAGSTNLYDAARPNGEKLNDGITKGAFAINSTYKPGTQAFVVFQAKVDTAFNDVCGIVRLRNVVAGHTAQITTDKQDNADVVVDTGKVCVQAVASCDSLTITKVDDKTFKLTAKATADGGATISKYVFDFGDGKTQEVASTAKSVDSENHAYATSGTFNAKVTITFSVNGAEQTKTCTVTVTPTVPGTTPNLSCDSLAIKQTDKQVELTATSTVTNADITGYNFTVTDVNDKVVEQKTVVTSATSATHTFNKPVTAGKYNVKVTLQTSKGEVTSDNCKGTFDITTVTQTQTFSCDSLKATVNGRKVKFEVKAPVTNGATVKNVTYDFGDKTDPLTTNASDMLTKEYEYKADGEYVARVKVTFTADGKDQVVSTDKCATVVKISTTPPPTPAATPPATPAKPATLPNTGAGEVLGVFVGATAAGAILYYLTAIRRNQEN